MTVEDFLRTVEFDKWTFKSGMERISDETAARARHLTSNSNLTSSSQET